MKIEEVYQKPIYNLKEQPPGKNSNLPGETDDFQKRYRTFAYAEEWWSRTGSNRRPEACKATALPTELRPHF